MEEVRIQRGGPQGKKSNRKSQILPYEDVVPGKKTFWLKNSVKG